MTNRVKIGAGGTAQTLLDRVRREEGCVTESPELVEQAATRLDEQTVTINELRRQHGVLMNALHLALPFVEDRERDPCYKAGAVAKAVASIMAAIAGRRG